MSWCKELVMAENRALFEIIDPATGQITEDAYLREKVFKYNFEGVIVEGDLNEKNLFVNTTSMSYLKVADIFLDHSRFDDKSTVYAFDLNKIFNETMFDSLFLYSNINVKNSFLLCTDLKENSKNAYECENFASLTTSPHSEVEAKSIPPYFEDKHRESTLNTINIIHMRQFALREKFSFLLVKIPDRTSNKQDHQLILKFDWYKISERVQTAELPSFLASSRTLEVSRKHLFQRIYLPELQSVLQAYNLVKSSRGKCDKYLSKKSASSDKPLSHSSLMMQFHEPLRRSFTDRGDIKYYLILLNVKF